jgi:tetratricopeptide (TPR) repeat protein
MAAYTHVVSEQYSGGDRSQSAVDDLLSLALSRPREALARARQVLRAQPDSYAASVAHQVVGIVLREFGDVDAGVREVRTALRLARRTGLAEREADVLATLGVALVYSGRTTAGLNAFGRALENSGGVMSGRVLVRRGMALLELGRYRAALEDLQHATAIARRGDEPLWLARAVNARAVVYLALGQATRADADFLTAERLYVQAGQELGSTYTVHNRAVVAFSTGDLLSALTLLDQTAERYERLNVVVPRLATNRCAVLLAAGLTDDALAVADAAVRDIEERRGESATSTAAASSSTGSTRFRAELLLTAANCALAAARPQAAIDRAQSALLLFRSQRSRWWQAHAAAALLQSQYATGKVSKRLLGESSRVALRLSALGSREAVQAHVLAGRAAVQLGLADDARRHFVAAAQCRRGGPALVRASGWLGEALRAQAAGDTRQMLAACRRGLAILDEHQLTLGASELRARATAHGGEFAMIAQRHAAGLQRPRLLLSWSERWRATALAVPAVRPPADDELVTGLTALRYITRRLEQARLAPSGSSQREQQRLEQEQRRLEGAVRDRALRAPATARKREAFSIPLLLDELADTQLVEIVDVDGVLHCLLCDRDGVRQYTAGHAAAVNQAADFARHALRRLARTGPADNAAGALAILARAGPRLQDELLGPAAQCLGDRPVVIVPPGKMHAIPWSLLPVLRDRAFSVAPSASAWLRARAAPEPPRRRVLLASGPGLTTADAEVEALAKLYGDATVLDQAAATTENVLRELDGAWLAHIAAHGTFRADSPLFSSLRLHDGPLTVYDLERLGRAPYRLILASCESGVAAPAGADELLGLVSSLLPLGTAGIVASVVPVNDEAVVPAMLALHHHLHAGQTLAEALQAVRRAPGADPIQQAIPMSLLALGAA